jgi:hypothetical protein
MKWSRLSEQIFRIDKWSLCRGQAAKRSGSGVKYGLCLLARRLWNSKNSKANRIETMKGPAESGQICSVGRRKIAKKIAKNKRCYANTLRPRSRMLLKVSGSACNL